ncbi:MAG: Porphobilinogen deaminase [Verrucomicrobia subdivision 3 bacterium]|nr:Porphobilinogen deaminase [Limisphaerales bacterium]MCS1417747.1 Porphobilinogen deaminase [Limisphaerales bacterium]
MPSETLNRPLVIATRGSALALTQANYVQRRLQSLLPELPIKIKRFKTKGDQLQNKPQHEIPEHLPKGLFTKELENALLNGQADIAVHSLKDLPTGLPEGLKLAAVSPREDAREVLLTRHPLDLADLNANPLKALPQGAAIGTGSPRRQAFVSAGNPSLRTVLIRGNVPTRIRKLAKSPEVDAIILAAAGLRRLGYTLLNHKPLAGDDTPPDVFSTILPIQSMIPCVAQGAIGLEARSQDPPVQAICDQFNDPHTRVCVEAERIFLSAMGGGCQSPVAAHAKLDNGTFNFIAAKPIAGGVKIVEGKTDSSQAKTLATELADQLRAAS